MRVDEVPERIVADVSLGLKWILQEEHVDRAASVESGNVIATRVRRGDLDRARGNEALRDLQDLRPRTRLLDSAAVISALAIARDLAHPVYDCCYLALAIEEDAIMVTADRRFRSAVAAHPALADRVALLRDIVLR